MWLRPFDLASLLYNYSKPCKYYRLRIECLAFDNIYKANESGIVTVLRFAVCGPRTSEGPLQWRHSGIPSCPPWGSLRYCPAWSEISLDKPFPSLPMRNAVGSGKKRNRSIPVLSSVPHRCGYLLHASVPAPVPDLARRQRVPGK